VLPVPEPVSNQFEMEPLSRTQVLLAMALTSIVLLGIAKLWMYLGAVALLTWTWSLNAGIWGVGLGLLITGLSAVVYYLWPSYRSAADAYLDLVLKPLAWPDLIWLGLLPGMSEELLFRGVMLPALGLDIFAVIGSSICFGISHLNGWRQWPYAVWATSVGLLLAGSATMTNNLLVPVIAHLTTNFVSGLVWKLKRDRAAKKS
jgi:uncharacterized protein